MKRTFVVLSFAFVMAATTFGQAPSASQPKPERLGKQQLNTLIATAKTPAEHRRIAQYYEAKASDYEAQVQDHEQMIAAYKANSSLSTDKNRAGTINHCEYFVDRFKALAANSQELAATHERMAVEASEQLPSAGR